MAEVGIRLLVVAVAEARAGEVELEGEVGEEQVVAEVRVGEVELGAVEVEVDRETCVGVVQNKDHPRPQSQWAVPLERGALMAAAAVAACFAAEVAGSEEVVGLL